MIFYINGLPFYIVIYWTFNEILCFWLFPLLTTLPGDSSPKAQNDSTQAIRHVERKRNIAWKGRSYGLDIICNIHSAVISPSESVSAYASRSNFYCGDRHATLAMTVIIYVIAKEQSDCGNPEDWSVSDYVAASTFIAGIATLRSRWQLLFMSSRR